MRAPHLRNLISNCSFGVEYPAMKFSIDLQDRYVVLSLQEEKLDSRVSPKLKSELVLLNAEGNRNIILELSKVQHADSSGISSLLIANRLCSQANGIFALSNVNSSVRKILTISQLESVLNIFPTTTEAIKAVFENELGDDLKVEEDDADDISSEIASEFGGLDDFDEEEESFGNREDSFSSSAKDDF